MQIQKMLIHNFQETQEILQKRHFNGRYSKWLPFACAQHRQHLGHLSIIMVGVISLTAFQKTRLQSHSPSTNHNLLYNGLRSVLEEGQLSVSLKSGTCSCNHFSIFFSLHEQARNPLESTTHLHPQIQFLLEVVRHNLTRLGRPECSSIPWRAVKWDT